MAKTPVDRIKAKREEMAAIQKQIEVLETRQALKLGKLAVAAGLGEVDVTDAALMEALREIAGRFRGRDKIASSELGDQANPETAALKPAPRSGEAAAHE